MALVQIRVECRKRFRECTGRCFGCKEATVVEVKNLSGRPVTNDPSGFNNRGNERGGHRDRSDFPGSLGKKVM